MKVKHLHVGENSESLRFPLKMYYRRIPSGPVNVWTLEIEVNERCSRVG